MLEHLHVKNLALIDEIEVDFSEGLNILSGETGAGKSIIIGSINIALGGKASKELIRKGAEYALVEIVFSVYNENIIKELEDMEIEVEDNTIIISRKIMPSKCINKINGQNVTISMLKNIAHYLIDIHGQHENQSLLVKKNHLSLLDRFAKNELENLLSELSLAYKKYISVKKELEISCVDEEKRIREISFLEYEINEITSAKLIKDEDICLDEKYKKLSNMHTIMSTLNTVHNLLSDAVSGSAADNISHSVRELSRISDLDSDIENQLNQLITIDDLVSGVNKDISSYMDKFEDISEELSEVEERLNLINSLKMKYGNSIEEIEEYLHTQEDKLNKLKNYDEYICNLKKKVSELEDKVDKISEKVSNTRKEKGKILTKLIREALIDLNFIDVQFEMIFNRTKEYTANGYDDAGFYISTNPGELLRPLNDVASGGEISRIMLAIKSVLSEIDSLDSLIFDEIDTGISGRTAQKVSEKLALIAKKRQVICITHLPQIAAMADSHYIIEKNSDGETTHTDIKKLDVASSVKEVARIIGGVQVTEAVMTNAKEMIQLANNIKLKIA